MKGELNNNHEEMRGWLYKEKSKATAFGGDTNRRWFAIERIVGTGHIDSEEPTKSDDAQGASADSPEVPEGDLALCYYKSKAMGPYSSSRNEKCGWFFLSDVEGVEQDSVGHWITIRHPSRTYRLRAPDHSQHNQWFEALTTLCGGGRGDVGGGDETPPAAEAEAEHEFQMQSDDISTATSSSEEGYHAEDQSNEKEEGAGVKDQEEKEEEEEESQAVTEINFLRQLTGSPPLKKPVPARCNTRGVSGPQQVNKASPPPDTPREAEIVAATPPPPSESFFEHNTRHCDFERSHEADISEQGEAQLDSLSPADGEGQDPFVMPSERKERVRSIDRSFDHRMFCRSPDASNGTMNKRLGRAIEGNSEPSTCRNPSAVAQGTTFSDVMMVQDIETSSSSSSDDDVDLSLEKHVRSFFAPSKTPSLVSLGREEDMPVSSPDGTTTRPTTTPKKKAISAFIPPGLTPDANFATADWDEPSPDQRATSSSMVSGKPSQRHEHHCSIPPDEDFINTSWDSD